MIFTGCWISILNLALLARIGRKEGRKEGCAGQGLVLPHHRPGLDAFAGQLSLGPRPWAKSDPPPRALHSTSRWQQQLSWFGAGIVPIDADED